MQLPFLKTKEGRELILVKIVTENPGEYEVSIFNINGRLLFSKQRFIFTKKVDLTSPSRCDYFVDVYDIKADKMVLKKIVKMR